MTTILTVTDDTYDAYATYEELQPFTEAVQRSFIKINYYLWGGEIVTDVIFNSSGGTSIA